MTKGHYYEDVDGNIVHVPIEEIQGIKTMADGSTRFKFIGGPYHDMVFRIYRPYDEVVWPDGTTYRIHPPLNLRKSKQWTFVHDMAATDSHRKKNQND